MYIFVPIFACIYNMYIYIYIYIVSIFELILSFELVRVGGEAKYS